MYRVEQVAATADNDDGVDDDDDDDIDDDGVDSDGGGGDDDDVIDDDGTAPCGINKLRVNSNEFLRFIRLYSIQYTCIMPAMPTAQI